MSENNNNKESWTKFFKKVIIGVIAGGGLCWATVEAGLNRYFDYLDAKEENALYRDSVITYNERLQYEQKTFRAVKLINLLDDIQEKYPKVNSVTIYKLHDHGKTLTLTESWYATILYQETAQGIRETKPDWQGRALPEGWLRYNLKVQTEGVYYVPDVSLEPEIYSGITKYHIDEENGQSLLGFYLGSNDNFSELYFISMGFSERHPALEYRDLLLYMQEKTEFLKNLLLI